MIHIAAVMKTIADGIAMATPVGTESKKQM
jgi:hypothetical protein